MDCLAVGNWFPDSCKALVMRLAKTLGVNGGLTVID
jgi:hypothetical protein